MNDGHQIGAVIWRLIFNIMLLNTFKYFFKLKELFNILNMRKILFLILLKHNKYIIYIFSK